MKPIQLKITKEISDFLNSMDMYVTESHRYTRINNQIYDRISETQCNVYNLDDILLKGLNVIERETNE